MLQKVLLFSALSLLMSFSMFFRVSNAVIAPDLVSEFNLDAVSLGMLAGSFFYAFALVQIPLGPLLDRFGPRSMLTIFALFGASGSVVFAVSPSYGSLLAGRIMLGIGMACALMGALKTFATKWGREQFARLSGALVAVGTVGSLLAASPLAIMTSLVGWRKVFLLMAAITAFIAFLFFAAFGKPPKADPTPDQPADRKGLLSLARLVFGTLSFWQICSIAFARYGTFVSLQGLWLGLYLMDVKQMSPVEAGHVLALIAVSMGVGSLVAGHLSDKTFRSRKGVAMGGSICYAMSLFPLTGLVPLPGVTALHIVAVFIGFFSGFGNLVYAHVKEIFPGQISGTVMAWLNFFVMIGGATLTPLFGKIIDLYPHTGLSYPPAAYHLVFLICFLIVTACTIFYAFSTAETKIEG
jgi:MFS family permease